MKYTRALITALLFAPIVALHATEFYVANTSNDKAVGTLTAPLKSIQAAFNKAGGGDTILLREGIYREAVALKNKSGKDGAPITLKAYPGELVILDGTEAAPKTWTVYKGKIYKTPVDAKIIEQLFAGREMMIEARWPNITFDQRLERSRWAQVDKGSMHGKIVCEEIAKMGIDFTGATACLNVAHQFWTWSRPVTRHQAGTNTLEYPANLKGLAFCDPALYPKIPEWVTKTWEDDYFYLYGKLELLDAETEWF